MPSSGLTRLQKIDTSRVGDRVRPRLKPRGLPPALEPHLVYDCVDPIDAAILAEKVFGPCRIEPARSREGDFRATFHAVLLRDVLLGHLDLSTEAVLAARSTPEDFLVLLPASGTSTVSVGDTTVEANPVTAVVVNPCTALSVHCYEQAAHVVLRVPRRALELHLTRLVGRSLERPLQFEPRFDVSGGAASRWNFAVQMLHAELFDPDSLLGSGTGVGQLEEFLMSSLLYCHDSNHGAELRFERASAHGRTVRAACEFIEANLASALTLQSIADGVGVGVRTLQFGFRSQLATTPMAYVRDRRLERVRADLADASGASRTSVSAVAGRWGFTHLGRFATEYRRRFGEAPSQTLRR